MGARNRAATSVSDTAPSIASKAITGGPSSRFSGGGMPGELIDGKKIADEVRAELKPRLVALAKDGIVPGLAAIIVGEDPGSKLYVKMKGKGSEEIGLAHWTVELLQKVSERRVLDEAYRLHTHPKVHGMLVLQPLPPQV